MSSSVEGSLFVKIGFVLDSQSLDDIIEYTRRKLEEEGIGGGFLAAARGYGGVAADPMPASASLSTATEDKIERLVNTVEKQTKMIEEAATESAVVSAAAAPEIGEAYGPTKWSWLKQKDTGIFAGTMDKKFFEGVNEYVENYMRNVKGFAMKKPYPYERLSPAGWIEETMGTEELALATIGASTEGGAPAKKLLERLLGEDVPEGLREKIGRFTSGDEEISLRHIYAGFGEEGKGARFELGFQQAALTESGAEMASVFSKELMDYVNDRMRNDDEFYRAIMEVMTDVISGARGDVGDPISKREVGGRISGMNMQTQVAITSGIVDEAVARVVMSQQGGNIFLRRISEGALGQMEPRGGRVTAGRTTRGLGLKMTMVDGEPVYGLGPTQEYLSLARVDPELSAKSAHEGGYRYRHLFPGRIWKGEEDAVLGYEERKEEEDEDVVEAGTIGGDMIAKFFAAAGTYRLWDEAMGRKISEGKVGAEGGKVRYMPSFAESQRDLEISAEMDALILTDTEGKFSPQEKIEAAMRNREVRSTPLYGRYSPAREFQRYGVSGGYITEGDPLESYPSQKDWSPAWGGRSVPTQTQIADEIAFGEASARIDRFAPGESVGELFDGSLESKIEEKAREGLEIYRKYMEELMNDYTQHRVAMGGFGSKRASAPANPEAIGKWMSRERTLKHTGVKTPSWASGATSVLLTDMLAEEFGFKDNPVAFKALAEGFE